MKNVLYSAQSLYTIHDVRANVDGIAVDVESFC